MSAPRSAAAVLALGLVLAPRLATADAAGLDLDLYTELLQRHTREVSDLARVRVDYAGLRDSEDWRRLIANLSAADPARLRTRAERIAFWINAYNVLAIEWVVRGEPQRSIRDLGSLLRPVWKREAGKIGGEGYSLDRIEHEILRPMGEPRIHFAIVCASLSCPALRREAWRVETLDADLEQASRAFVSDPDKGARLERARTRLRVSRIFEWFAEDFERVGGVRAFVEAHLPEPQRVWLREHPDATLAHLDYDWSLNALSGVQEQ